jgi:hypothetical protein
MMHFRFKGYGYSVWFIVLGAFLVLRPIFESLTHSSEDALRRHLNAAILAASGAIIFLIAARADKKAGIDVFSRSAWTSDIMLSQHVCFSVPMRLFGVLLLLVSLFL